MHSGTVFQAHAVKALLGLEKTPELQEPMSTTVHRLNSEQNEIILINEIDCFNALFFVVGGQFLNKLEALLMHLAFEWRFQRIG